MGAQGNATSYASILGGLTEILAESQADSARRRLSRFNEAQANRAATDAIRRGEESAADIAEQGRGVIGAQRAGYAGQGVVADDVGGSPGDVRVSSAQAAQVDMQRVRTNAMREALGYRIQSIDTRMQSNLATSASRQRIMGTVLTRGAKAYADWES